MADLNNNLNVNSMGKGYAPNFKKGEIAEHNVEQKSLENQAAEKNAAHPVDAAGRYQVQKASKTNFKADMKSFEKNPALAAKVVNAGDIAYELMEAQGVTNAYEKSCDGSINAAKL